MSKTKIQYALDIGNYSIKYVKFQTTWNAVEILDARIHVLPQENLSLSSEQEKMKIITHSLDVLFSAEDTTVMKELVVVLPADLTVVRYITLPNIPFSKIDRIIRFEAEQQIPLPFHEIEWAYAVLPIRKKREVDVVITATRKEVIDLLREKLSVFNFNVLSFETGQLMLANLALQYVQEKSGTILLDLGAKSVHVILLCRGVIWGRTLRFGMFKMSRAVSERVHIPLKDAEILKKEYHAIPTDQVTLGIDMSEEKKTVLYEIEEDILYEIVNEVSRTISYFLSIMRGAVFNKILITGGGANIQGAASFFEKNLGIPVSVAPMLESISAQPHLKERLVIDKNYYSVVLGAAALSSFSGALSTNLINSSIREQRVAAVYKKNYIFFFVILFATLSVIVLSLVVQVRMKEKKVAMIEEQVSNIEKNEKELKQLERKIIQKNKQLMVIDAALDERDFFVSFFAMLDETLPADIWFESISYTRDTRTFQISGKTVGTLDLVHAYRDTLSSVPFVRDVQVDAASIEQKQDEYNYRFFSLTIRCNEPL
jgi:type IV pilus assembly protein PilM